MTRFVFLLFLALCSPVLAVAALFAAAVVASLVLVADRGMA